MREIRVFHVHVTQKQCTRRKIQGDDLHQLSAWAWDEEGSNMCFKGKTVRLLVMQRLVVVVDATDDPPAAVTRVQLRGWLRKHGPAKRLFFGSPGDDPFSLFRETNFYFETVKCFRQRWFMDSTFHCFCCNLRRGHGSLLCVCCGLTLEISSPPSINERQMGNNNSSLETERNCRRLAFNPLKGCPEIHLFGPEIRRRMRSNWSVIELNGAPDVPPGNWLQMNWKRALN